MHGLVTLLTQLCPRYHYNAAHPVVCMVPLQQSCSPSCVHGLLPLQQRCSPNCMHRLVALLTQLYTRVVNAAHPVVCTVPLPQRCSPSCMQGTITTTLLTQLYARYHYNNAAHPVVCTVPLEQRCSPNCMHGTITKTLLTQLYARVGMIIQLYARVGNTAHPVV